MEFTDAKIWISKNVSLCRVFVDQVTSILLYLTVCVRACVCVHTHACMCICVYQKFILCVKLNSTHLVAYQYNIPIIIYANCNNY